MTPSTTTVVCAGSGLGWQETVLKSDNKDWKCLELGIAGIHRVGELFCWLAGNMEDCEPRWLLTGSDSGEDDEDIMVAKWAMFTLLHFTTTTSCVLTTSSHHTRTPGHHHITYYTSTIRKIFSANWISTFIWKDEGFRDALQIWRKYNRNITEFVLQ